MKKFFLATFALVSFSCSSFHSNFNQPKPVTGRDLPPILIRDLSQLQFCNIVFWKSAFGQQALLSREKFDKIELEIDAGRKPVCSVSQGIMSVTLMSRLKNRVFQDLDSTKTPISAKINLSRKVLSSQGGVLLTSKLTQGEVLLQLVLLDGVIERSKKFKNSEIDQLIKDLSVDLKNKQDTILKNAFLHDAILLQSEAYRSEIYDLRGSLGEDQVSIPTQAQLDEFAKFNKYAEILTIEKFKNEVLENFECIKSDDCKVCENKVEKKTCGVAKTTEQLRDENSIYVQLLSQNMNSTFQNYYKRTSDIIALWQK